MRKEHFRYALDRSGHNVPSLAEITGVSERTLWRLLSTDATANEDTLLAIAGALDCSVDYLVGASNDPKPVMRFDNLTAWEMDVLRNIRIGDKMGAIRLIVESA